MGHHLYRRSIPSKIPYSPELYDLGMTRPIPLGGHHQGRVFQVLHLPTLPDGPWLHSDRSDIPKAILVPHGRTLQTSFQVSSIHAYHSHNHKQFGRPLSALHWQCHHIKMSGKYRRHSLRKHSHQYQYQPNHQAESPCHEPQTSKGWCWCRKQPNG